MKKRFSLSCYFILATCYFLLATCTQSQEIKKVRIDELDEYITRSTVPLIVNFWATWCAPCIEEIPYFQETVKKYNGENVKLLMVSLDFENAFPGKIKTFARNKNVASQIFWLDESNADIFCPRIDSAWSGSIPASLFINNKTGYRKFFERQLTPRQVEKEVLLLIKG